jgi:hypothetical protein
MNESQIIAAEQVAQEQLAAATEEYTRTSASLRAAVGALVKEARGGHSGPQTAALIGLPPQRLNELEHGGRYAVEKGLEVLAAVRAINWASVPNVRRGRAPKVSKATPAP